MVREQGLVTCPKMVVGRQYGRIARLFAGAITLDKRTAPVALLVQRVGGLLGEGALERHARWRWACGTKEREVKAACALCPGMLVHLVSFFL
jgi:hypothetical protein